MNQIMNQSNDDYTHQLRSLMQRVGIPSFKALGRAVGVSQWQVQQLRQGKAAQMQLTILYQFSQTLQVSLLDIVTTFSKLSQGDAASLVVDQSLDTESSDAEMAPGKTTEPSLSDTEIRLREELKTWKQEYQQLQTQMQEQRSHLHQEFLQANLQILESLLLQLPTAIHAAQTNPQVSATRLVPLLRPLEQLLRSWGIEAIALVGSEIPYDPQWHQLIEGTATVGDLVKVRYTGYRQGEKLLYRAKVSQLAPERDRRS